MFRFAAGVAVVQGASPQSDTESIAPATAALKRDLEVVEARFRVPAERRARAEAELLHITCGETYLRKQQRRFLHCIFAAKHGEMADTSEDPVPEDAAEETHEPAAAESTVVPARLPNCVYYTSRSLSGSVPLAVLFGPCLVRSVPFSRSRSHPKAPRLAASRLR